MLRIRHRHRLLLLHIIKVILQGSIFLGALRLLLFLVFVFIFVIFFRANVFSLSHLIEFTSVNVGVIAV